MKHSRTVRKISKRTSRNNSGFFKINKGAGGTIRENLIGTIHRDRCFHYNMVKCKRNTERTRFTDIVRFSRLSGKMES